MFAQFASAVVRRRGLTAAFSIIAFVALAAGGALLKVEFSVLAFFAGDDPAKVDFDEFKARWGADDDVVLLIATVDNGSLITKARLAALHDVGEELAKDERVQRVFGIVDAPLPDVGTGLIDNRPIHARVPDDDGAFSTFQRRILDHAVYVPSMLARDGSATAFLVETTLSSDDIQSIQPMMEDLRARVAKFDGKEGITYAFAGLPAVRSDFFKAFMQDQALYIPLGMLLIISMLFVVFRRLHGVVIPAVAAVVPVMMTFGIMGYTGEPIGLINQSYSILLPTIAVADAIHLVSRFHEEARRLARPGERLTVEQRNAAIIRALEKVGAACALTSLTTAIGFGSLLVARMPSMRTFGLYAAVGIVLAYGVVILVVPVMLTFVNGAVTAERVVQEGSRIDRLLAWCGHISVDKPVAILSITVVVTVVFAYFSTKTVTDNNLTGMLKADHPTSVVNRITDDKLGGILSLEVALEGAPGALHDPAVLRAMLDVESWAKTIPELRAVLSPATFVAGMNEILVGERGIPDTREGVAQFLMLMDGDDAVSQMLSSDASHGRMQIRAKDIGGLAFTDLVVVVNDAMKKHLEPTGISYFVTGTPVIGYSGINLVTFDLRESLLLAFFVIALIIALLIRNVTVALLCLLPNALPLLVGYGLLGMMGWLLEPAGAVIFTVALGIAVDDTLHLIVRTKEELSHGRKLNEALKASVLHSGRAVTVTSLILSGGFGVLMLSSFPATMLMGALGTIIIVTALLCDVFVLPALLSMFGQSLKSSSSPRV